MTHIKKGETVVLHWRPSLGIQAEPAKYRWRRKTVNAGWVTTFQNYSIVSENRLTPIPKDFDLKLAPLFGCALTSAMGVINNDAQLKIGQSVVVFGVGGVGVNIVQAASMVSAYPIIAIDKVKSKLILAKKFGATHTLLASQDPSIAKNADVVIDTTGNSRVIELAYELTHPDGKTILVGVPKEKVSIYTLPLHFKKTFHGSHGGSSEPHIDIPRLIKLYEVGMLKLKGLITHEFPLKRINDAISLVRSGNAGRILIHAQTP